MAQNPRLKTSLIQNADGTADLVVIYKNIKSWPVNGGMRYEMVEHSGPCSIKVDAFGYKLKAKLYLHLFADVPDHLKSAVKIAYRRYSNNIPKSLLANENTEVFRETQTDPGVPEGEV